MEDKEKVCDRSTPTSTDKRGDVIDTLLLSNSKVVPPLQQQQNEKAKINDYLDPIISPRQSKEVKHALPSCLCFPVQPVSPWRRRYGWILPGFRPYRYLSSASSIVYRYGIGSERWRQEIDIGIIKGSSTASILLQQRKSLWLDHVYPALTTQIVLAEPCPPCLSCSNNADCTGWTMSTMSILPQKRRVYWLNSVHHVYPAPTTLTVLAEPCPPCLSCSNNADCTG
ncbi:hypothetical protein PoB_006520900 [Plakobranchus ocellatus]|uniref:Spondin domain-containing protein n=1 Tax=Plakobranchus ocellatus TaxID=259542 RepID=A0AAV4D3I3_9GAST|nr:hypothetical protein PoB_006520900 [Plakobranchus ocellatus]